jgi:ElaB/YqjD/DUF883 family membrane-anchored ribosome-binding protein
MTSTSNKPITGEDGLSERMRDASERVIEFKDEAARGFGKRIDALGALMKKHPLLSIGIGFGVGYLMARIIRRR